MTLRLHDDGTPHFCQCAYPCVSHDLDALDPLTYPDIHGARDGFLHRTMGVPFFDPAAPPITPEQNAIARAAPSRRPVRTALTGQRTASDAKGLVPIEYITPETVAAMRRGTSPTTVTEHP